MSQHRGAAIGSQIASSIGIPPKSVSDVQAQLDYLDESIAKLDAVACNLIAKLSPVLCPVVDAEVQAVPSRAVAATGLANQISTLTSRVDSVRGAIADAYDRLGV